MARTLRIFCAIPESANNDALPGSSVWFRNLVEPLIDMGHDVVQPSFSVGAHYRATYAHGTEQQEKARDIYGQRLVEDVRKAHAKQPLDLLLTYYDSFQLSPEAVHELREITCPVVNYWSNAVHQFEDIREIAPHFDYCIVTEREALPKYHAAGARTIRWQMAANPKLYKPLGTPHRFDLSFVGQKYLNRGEFLHHLYSGGVDLRVHGPGWYPYMALRGHESIAGTLRHLPGRLLARHRITRAWRQGAEEDPYALPKRAIGNVPSDDEMVKLHNQSRICLNLSEVQDDKTGVVTRFIKLRDFEAPMCGGFLITGQQEELAEYYEPGKEIVCYETKEDLLEKVKYYLQHPAERDRIREAGFRRALAEHTWEHRYAQLFKELSFS